jgi:hypothetical protein
VRRATFDAIAVGAVLVLLAFVGGLLVGIVLRHTCGSRGPAIEWPATRGII